MTTTYQRHRYAPLNRLGLLHVLYMERNVKTVTAQSYNQVTICHNESSLYTFLFSH